MQAEGLAGLHKHVVGAAHRGENSADFYRVHPIGAGHTYTQPGIRNWNRDSVVAGYLASVGGGNGASGIEFLWNWKS